MITVACIHCGTRHQIVLDTWGSTGASGQAHAPVDQQGGDHPDVACPVRPASASRRCQCGSHSFDSLALANDTAGSLPALLCGPIGLKWAERFRDLHFVGCVNDRVAVVSNDLSWGIEAGALEIERLCEDWNIRGTYGDESPVTDFAPMAKKADRLNASDEIARLGIADRDHALAAAVRHVLAELFRWCPPRTPHRTFVRDLDRAGGIAFLSMEIDDRQTDFITLVTADYVTEQRIRIRARPGDRLHDEEDAQRGFRLLEALVRDQKLEVFAQDEVTQPIAAYAALVGHTIKFPIERADAVLRDTWAACGRPCHGDYPPMESQFGTGPRALVRAWRAAAGEPPAHPVIFLDIDGALLPTRARALPGNQAAIERILRGERPRRIEDFPQAFDPVAVALLNRLADRADAHFVISSNWCTGGDQEPDRAEKVRALLIQNGVAAERFHDDFVTPRTFRSEKPRELQLWLDEHPEVWNWITIEDDYWSDDRCIPCLYEDGLSTDVYHKACLALGVQDPVMGAGRPRRRKRTPIAAFWY